jgi:hypothetical protein
VPCFVASAAQGDPEALRGAGAIGNAPEVAPPGVARKTEGVELAPLALQLHLDIPLHADDVPDASCIEHREQGSIGKATIRRQPHALRCNILEDKRERPLDDGEFVALHPTFEYGVVVGTPEDRQGTAAYHSGDHQQMLMILAGPGNGKTYTPGAGDLSACLTAKPLGAVLWREPLVVQEA